MGVSHYRVLNHRGPSARFSNVQGHVCLTRPYWKSLVRPSSGTHVAGLMKLNLTEKSLLTVQDSPLPFVTMYHGGERVKVMRRDVAACRGRGWGCCNHSCICCALALQRPPTLEPPFQAEEGCRTLGTPTANARPSTWAAAHHLA